MGEEKTYVLSTDYALDTALVAVTYPVSLSPHGISAEQAAQDYYPIS